MADERPLTADPERLLPPTLARVVLNHKSDRTLKEWRAQNRGPRFYRFGRAVKYRVGDLLAWRERHAVETRDSRELQTA